MFQSCPDPPERRYSVYIIFQLPIKVPFHTSFITVQCFQFLLAFWGFQVNLLLMFHHNQVDSFSIYSCLNIGDTECASVVNHVDFFVGLFRPSIICFCILSASFPRHLHACCCFSPVHYINLMCGAAFHVHLRRGWVLLNIHTRTHLHPHAVYGYVHFLYTKSLMHGVETGEFK